MILALRQSRCMSHKNIVVYGRFIAARLLWFFGGSYFYGPLIFYVYLSSGKFLKKKDGKKLSKTSIRSTEKSEIRK